MKLKLEENLFLGKLKRIKGEITTGEGIWTLLGNGMILIIGIITVKVISSNISTSEYGKVNLILGIVNLLYGTLLGSLFVVHNRLFHDYKYSVSNEEYLLRFRKLILITVLVVIFIYFVFSFIYKLVFSENIYLQGFIYISFLVLFQSFVTEKLNIYEAYREQKSVALINIVNKSLYPIFLLILINLFAGSFQIIIISQLLPLIIIFFFAGVPKELKSESEDKPKEVKDLSKSILAFGWGLPLGYLLMWILTTSDRYLIEHYLTFEEVGIYSLNYGLWAMPFMVINGWLELLTRPILYNYSANNNTEGIHSIIRRKIIFAFILSVVTALIIYYILADIVVSVLLDEAYWYGKSLMLIIMLAHILQLLGYSILSFFLSQKDSKINLIATGIAAVTNITLNIILIPSYQIIGAAISTLIAYFMWLLVFAYKYYVIRKTQYA